MKVLYIIPSTSPYYGGISKVPLSLAEELPHFGVQVDVVATNDDMGKRIVVPLQKWIVQQGYRVQFFSFFNIGSYKVSFSLTRWLWKNIQQYDVIHIHGIFSFETFISYTIARLRQISYLITPQGMLEPWALAYKGWKKRPYYFFFEKAGLNHAKILQALAAPESENIKALKLDVPVVIIPNGIPRKDYESLPPPDIFYQKFPQVRGKNIILFLGRIDPKKGLDLLAKAFEKIRHDFSNAHLVIAGPDNTGFLKTAKGYFETEKCDGQVTFTGMLDSLMKRAALAASQIYISPAYSEGFSISILEGMAAGLPCIFTKGCNFPEAAEANVAYIVDADSDSIAKALNYCLKNPDEAHKVGMRAKDFILKNYTWAQIAPKMKKVYESIAGNNP